MKQMRWSFNLTLILCFSLLSPLTYAATINIPAEQPTIQAGIDTAQNGDIVLVDDGIYKGEGNVNIDFTGKRITLKSRNGAEATIIDCEKKFETRGFSFQNDETVDSVLDGFTIKNGVHEHGGGIYLSYASPTIKNCVIDGNRSIKRGAGIYCLNSDPIITDCKIKSNFGVGIYISGEPDQDGIVLKETSTQLTIEHCTISNNTGSGIIGFDSVNPLISNCIVSENGGRGIFYTFFARAYSPITNCLIEKNNGGGVEITETSFLSIENSIIMGNTAEYGGGISCSPTSEIRVSDCIIVQNTATRGGGIEVVSTRGAATITHCTITQNTATHRGGGIHASIETGHFTLTDSIVWGNSSDGTHAEVFASGIVIAIKSCDIRNGLGGIGGNPDEKYFTYEDNIDEDPLFVDADSGDFRLKPNSPAAAMGAQASHIGLTAVSQHGKQLVRWADLKRKPRITSIF